MDRESHESTLTAPRPSEPTAGCLHQLRLTVEKRITAPLSFRRDMLQALRKGLLEHEQGLMEALFADLRKPPVEAYASEIGVVLTDIDHTLRHLSRWARPQRRPTPPLAWPAVGHVHSQPYGLVLIIGPWNYPVQLLLSPLVAALAAGNCVCLKPSELAPRTSAALAALMRHALPSDVVALVEGGRETAESLLQEKFDHIFFTGSPAVGRKVMAAAARHLTPVTLELGGKSPCIVCADVAPSLAAKRIAWGKFMNAGQTCMAPDFVLVERRAMTPLLEALCETVVRFYGTDVRTSADFGRIVNSRHFQRLVGYLSQGRVVFGGDHDVDDLFIGPTIMTDVDLQAPVMVEEIFGPILPVLPFDSLDDALRMLHSRPKPLALYMFSDDRSVQQRVLAHTDSGGVCINDTITHAVGKGLPFGGVGESGMGAYHGKAGFDAFTHCRSVMRRSTFVDFAQRYPPYTRSLTTLKRIYGYLLRR